MLVIKSPNIDATVPGCAPPNKDVSGKVGFNLDLWSLPWHLPGHQCDQIGRFIGLWATLKSLWQQLICPNLSLS